MENNIVLTSKNINDVLNRMKNQMAMVLPNHMTPERMTRIALNMVRKNPDLLNCRGETFLGSLMGAAQLGLEPDGILGQAYLIPYKDTCTLIIGYKGLIDLARRSGDVSSISAHEVCENDNFTFDLASGDLPSHTYTFGKDRGEVIAFYAVAKFKDGSHHWDIMEKKEVDAIRKRSRAANSGPWVTDYIEMGKKTVIRRIAKYLPMSVQRAAAYEDAKLTWTPEQGDTIDVDYTEVPFDQETGEIKDEQTTQPVASKTASVLDRLKQAKEEKKEAANSQANEEKLRKIYDRYTHYTSFSGISFENLLKENPALLSPDIADEQIKDLIEYACLLPEKERAS